MTTQKETYSLAPRNLDEAMKFSEMLAKSTAVPKTYVGKPGNIVAAMQLGHEIGIGPLQSLKNIAVINGNPSLWGDAMLGLVQAHPKYEYHKETDDGHKATCTVKRKGAPEHTVTFSMDDAKQAGLIGKQGPWQTGPRRMRQMRARGFALRDQFADALCGMITAEEAMDYPINVNTGKPSSIYTIEKSDNNEEKVIENVEVIQDVILASDAQFKELVNLVSILDIPKDTTDKWLEKAGVEDFEKMPNDKIQKCIDMLKDKIND